MQNNQQAKSPFNSAIESIGMMVDYPLRVFSDSLMNSGSSTPRMTLSRDSSFSSIPIEAIRRMEEDKMIKIPSDIVWIIISNVAKNCKKVGNNADLLKCALVDKRFNHFSTVFLWHHLELKSDFGFTSLIKLFANPAKRSRFGEIVKGISLSRISFIEKAQWEFLLRSCPLVEVIGVERCLIEQEQSTPLEILLEKLQVLVVSDCATCPIEPILLVCKVSPNLAKLSLSGVNFNEKQICELISYCQNLRDIKLGSHAGPSLTAVGNSGGDEFARTLSEKCPLLVGADLTGIISMTDRGWTTLMLNLGTKLQKFYIRRAMQISLDSFLLVSKCTNLKKLTIANVPHLTDGVLVFLLEEIGHQLSFLQLEAIPITNTSLQQLAQSCTKLVQLRIFQCKNWASLDVLLENSRLNRLQILVIHGCDQLQTSIECSCSTNLESPESLSLPDVRGIRDTGNISPRHLTSPMTPGEMQQCNFTTAISLTHFELVSCEMIDLKGIKALLNHWTGLKRFIFVGARLDSTIRKMLLKRKTVVTSIYALRPSSPF